MVRLNAAVNIMADPGQVFSIIEDVDVRARLNPHATVLGISKLTTGSIDVGSQFFYRMIVEGNIVEHISTCTIYEPGAVMEMASNSKPPYVVKVSCEAISGGTRLIHEEFFSLMPLCWPIPKAHGWLGKILRSVFGHGDIIRQSQESIAMDEAELVLKLEPYINNWLNKIKKYVESGAFYA